MSARPLLHVFGCGRAARTLARRLLATGRLRPGLVVNRSLDSARQAVAFIGAGQPAERFDARLADGWLMLGLPDGALADLAPLPGAGPAPPALAFHLSGSIEARVLRSLAPAVASVHPVRAFAVPQQAARDFAGTWCVAEGDPVALDCLRPVFAAAGARWLPFAAGDKAAWHAATVAASNYLVTVHKLARDLAARAGLPEEQAAEVLCDLQHGTLQSLRELGPRQALTGPIERADVAACRRLVNAAGHLDADARRLFSELGLATLAVAQAKRGRHADDERLKDLFSATSR